MPVRGRSLGLAAYRALSRRSSERHFRPRGRRPSGTVLWIHAGEPNNLLAVLDLAQRLCSARYGLHILISLPDQRELERALNTCAPHDFIQFEALPSEHPDAIKKFWRHWAPDVAIWTWGGLRPNLIWYAHQKGCPVALIDADEAGFDSRRDNWLPDVSRSILEPFMALMARSGAALHKLETLGVRTSRINVTPPLQAGGHALPCQDSDFTHLSGILSRRPVWLASHVHDEEVDIVLSAHRHAVRLSHRLLLVLNLARSADVEDCVKKIALHDTRCANWTDGEEPDDGTQVLLSSDDHDLGLFYRLAPVSFMGSSLVPGHIGRNPFEAAALGSAVLYGPNVRSFMPFYSRLAKAGAARIVKDGDTLGAAVSSLIAPDQAAAMAHAGWDVVSQGADLTDRVIDLVHVVLDGELESLNAPS